MSKSEFKTQNHINMLIILKIKNYIIKVVMLSKLIHSTVVLFVNVIFLNEHELFIHEIKD